MPQEQALKKPEKQEEIKNEESVDTLSALFDERDRPKSEKKEGRKAPETPESEKEEEAQSDKPSSQKEEVKAAKEDDDDDDMSPAELNTLKEELQKTQKRLSENQQYGRQNAQKIRNFQKAVKEMVVDGVLTDPESEKLLEILELGGEENKEEEEYHKGDAHPFAPIFKIANTELENIRKYTDDEFLQDKVDAFDYFLSVSSKEEIEEALEELTELMDNPVKLTKKMLSIGQKAYEESYKEIKEAGGFKHYLSKKSQEVEKLRKKIDKLEKKLAQYEDFDKPRYRMDETGDSEDGKAAQDTITALFAERDQVKRR